MWCLHSKIAKISSCVQILFNYAINTKIQIFVGIFGGEVEGKGDSDHGTDAETSTPYFIDDDVTLLLSLREYRVRSGLFLSKLFHFGINPIATKLLKPSQGFSLRVQHQAF